MITKRHHYLPEFYIKGFVNADNKVYVFDKKEQKFKKQEFSPKQIFFEWHRNTLLINGKKDDFIENLYGTWESLISPTYNKIKNQTGRLQYDVEDIFKLILLISLTYWRIPTNDTNAEKLVHSSTPKELFIKVHNKETKEEISQDFYKQLKEREGFVEMYKLAKPILEYISLDIAKHIQDWKIYNTGSNVQVHILGDDPIIFRHQPKKNILESELIFPLTKGITIYNTKGKVIKTIQPENRVKTDLMVFLQANRYVVGSNKEYLNFIQKLAAEYDTNSKVENLRAEIFEIFNSNE